MKVLITGSAGFIGFHLTIALLEKGYDVLGIDNINSYYDVNLKYDRLQKCGIEHAKISWNKEVHSSVYSGYRFVKLHLEDKHELMTLCSRHRFDVIVHLAAQAGVRYSITHPDAYIQSNLVGFFNILEACRYNSIKHFVYASSSSVYGLNEEVPFSVQHSTNHPVSLYAATKKSNELLAHTYSYLYKIPTTGLRFFTVYGPWGRPDMAYFLFADAIFHNKPIRVFNYGNMKRDFTYVDDVVSGIANVMEKPAQPNREWNGRQPDPSSSIAPYRIYNIGNNKPVALLAFIHELERNIGKKAKIEMHDMQAGDVTETWANVDALISNFGYQPGTTIETGIKNFIEWYQTYYGINQTAKPALTV